MDGEAGLDKVEVNGAAGAGDAFEIAPNGQRVKFDRTNLGAVHASTSRPPSRSTIRGLGGDDTLLVKPGYRWRCWPTAATGNDSLTGAEEQDTFFGGVGNDTLEGGDGNDLLDGQEGDDRLLARDGVGDLVRGGVGTDSAKVDKADIVVDVEKVDRNEATATRSTSYNHKAKVKYDRNKKRYYAYVKGAPRRQQGLAVALSRQEVLEVGRQVQGPPLLGQGEVRPRQGDEKRIKSRQAPEGATSTSARRARPPLAQAYGKDGRLRPARGCR